MAPNPPRKLGCQLMLMPGPGGKTQYLSGNNIEQTANTYKLNTCNKALIKTSDAKYNQLRLA